MAKRKCLLTGYETNCTTGCYNCDCGGEVALNDCYVPIYNIQRVCDIVGNMEIYDTEEATEYIRNELEKMVVVKPDVKPDDRWISVDERLPKPFERVLCYCISTSGDIDAYMIGCIDKHWGLLKGETFVSEKETHRIVAYWQSLPSRPTIDYCRFCTEGRTDYEKKR